VRTGAPSVPGFQLDQNFFGFKPADRVGLHQNLFNLIWHGAGRWDWDTVYNMPIMIRKLWISNVNRMVEAPAPNPNTSSTNNIIPKKYKK
jgi:hypothetical protein